MKKIFRIKCNYKAPHTSIMSLSSGRLNEVFEATDIIDAIDQFRRDWIKAKEENNWDIEYKHITNIECEYIGTVVK